MPEPALSLRHPGRLAVGIVVTLVAVNLRPALTGVAPVLNEVMRGTGLGTAGASALATLPVLCLGLSSAAATPLVRHLGLERTIVLLLGVIVTGLALRGIGGIAALFAGSLLAGCGIGLGNVLMPALLKRDFTGRPALMTGLYMTFLCMGAATAAAIAVPLLMATGGWSGALAFWAGPALVALLTAAWVWRAQIWHAAPTHRRADLRPPLPLLRSALAWQVTAFMGLQSMLAYAVFAWLAPMLRSRGDTAHVAGLVVSVSVLAQMVASLPMPVLAARLRSQGLLAALSMAMVAGSFVGLARLPLSWQWALATILGLGAGGAFALAITLMVLRSGDSVVAASLSSMSQGFGYTLAACGPLLMGLLHGLTGGWGGGEALFVLAGLGAAVAGGLAGRPRVLRRPA